MDQFETYTPEATGRSVVTVRRHQERLTAARDAKRATLMDRLCALRQGRASWREVAEASGGRFGSAQSVRVSVVRYAQAHGVKI